MDQVTYLFDPLEGREVISYTVSSGPVVVLSRQELFFGILIGYIDWIIPSSSLSIPKDPLSV